MNKTQLEPDSQFLLDKKKTGSHYTPTMLARFVAEEIVNANRELPTSIRILDPAVGDGELLLSILNYLSAQQSIHSDVIGFDTNSSVL